MSKSEIITTIIVALISFIGVLISAIMVNKTTKKISKSNEKFQEKWNQKNIDATLTASARIEWIQKVRNTTAELISLYFQAINTSDKQLLLNAVIEAQKQTELLILFFGPEKEKDLEYFDIMSFENNDNKNAKIVSFLDSLSKKLHRYYENAKEEKLSKLKNIRDRRYSEMQEHIVDHEYEEYTDDYGNEGVVDNPIFDEVYEKEIENVDKDIKDVLAVSMDINSDLIRLRNIIRIYLKIEWNKAKIGQ